MADPIPFPRRPRRQVDADDEPAKLDHDDNAALIVGHNLKRLRNARGYSLEKLAKLSGVSRGMLSQIELGRSAPSINVTFKIARAFDVPFSALLTDADIFRSRVLPAHDSKSLSSASGNFSSRALFPFDAVCKTEFYELRLAARGFERADAHAIGTLENLVVVRGVIEIAIRGETHRLGPGDAFLFQADSGHSYSNLSDVEALIYLVMAYRDSTA